MEKQLYEQLGVEKKVNELRGLLTAFLESMKSEDDNAFSQALENIIAFYMEGFLSTASIDALYEMIRNIEDPTELGSILKSFVATADAMTEELDEKDAFDEASDLLNDDTNTVC